MSSPPLPYVTDAQDRALKAMLRGEARRDGTGWRVGAVWWGVPVMSTIEARGWVAVERIAKQEGRGWLTADGRALAEALS